MQTEGSQVCFTGPIPFGQSLAPREFSKCVEAALSPLRSRGNQTIFLICFCSLQEQAVRDCPRGNDSPHGTRLQYKLNEDPSDAHPLHGIRGSQLNLSLVSRHAIRGEARITDSLPLSFQAGKSCFLQVVPTPSLSHGINYFCDPSVTTDEGFPSLGYSAASVFALLSQLQCDNNVRRVWQLSSY